MRRRIFGIFLALLSASIGTILLVMYVDSAKEDAVASVRLVDVYIVDEPIPKGTAPTADQIRIQKIPVSAKVDNSIVDLAAIKGLVATTTLLPGEQLVRERFASPQLVARGDIPPGLLEVTLPVARERAIGGKVRPGSRVAVLVTFDEGSGPDGRPLPQETHVLMHKVLVTAVQTEAPIVEEEQKGEGQPPAQTQAPQGSFLVTFAVDAPSAERLVFAQEAGSLWLAIEPDDASEGGTKLVTRDNVF